MSSLAAIEAEHELAPVRAHDVHLVPVTIEIVDGAGERTVVTTDVQGFVLAPDHGDTWPVSIRAGGEELYQVALEIAQTQTVQALRVVAYLERQPSRRAPAAGPWSGRQAWALLRRYFIVDANAESAQSLMRRQGLAD